MRGTLRLLPVVASLLAALLMGALTLAGHAATASVSIPPIYLGTGKIVTTGGQLYSFQHQTRSGVIYETSISLIGDHRHDTVKVRFNSGPYTTCATGDRIRGDHGFPDLTTVTCQGLNQNLDTSGTFTILVT